MEFMPLITSKLNFDMERNPRLKNDIMKAFRRFQNKDWGELPKCDKKANDEDLKNRDGHVLGRYFTVCGDIYINMVFDEPSLHSDVAVVMYCDEY